MTSTKILFVIIVYVVYMVDGGGEYSKLFEEVQSISLRREPPYYYVHPSPDHEYPSIVSMGLDKRRELCRTKAFDIVKNLGTFTLPHSNDYFVPIAQWYEVDSDRNSQPGFPCPSFPPLYVFGDDDQRYNVKIMNPYLNSDLEYEPALGVEEIDFSKKDVKDQKDEKNEEERLELRLLRKMIDIDIRRRWHICNKAHELIRFDVDLATHAVYAAPKIYEFSYTTGPSEIDTAFQCFANPEIFIRVGRSQKENSFLISLVEHDALKLKT